MDFWGLLRCEYGSVYFFAGSIDNEATFSNIFESDDVLMATVVAPAEPNTQ